MLSMYDRIAIACKEKGCTPGFMCDHLGLYRSFITELKQGRTRSLTTERVAVISDYLGCSCDWLIKGEEYKGSFTDDELEILHAYRLASQSEKDNVRFLLRDRIVSREDQAV